jgi:WxL domain surface cell wall-binding
VTRPQPHVPIRSVARAVLIGALLVVAAGASVLAGGARARATTCSGVVPAGTSCTITGTLVLTSGVLGLTTPTSLSWDGTVDGLDQQLVDTVGADQEYVVGDATGSATGWHVTISGTTFTTSGGTLPASGTFLTTGSVTSETSTDAPTAACSSGSTCTPPTDNTTYPVAITTAASSPTAVNIYDASMGTGLGSIIVGGASAANPVGWWLNVPADAQAGTYTSTLTMELISGP